MAFDCKSLDQFLLSYGDVLNAKARQLLDPLHVPSRDDAQAAQLKRPPFEAQGHVITAAVKALARQKAVLLVAEMGTGKTLMAQGVAQTLARYQTGKSEKTGKRRHQQRSRGEYELPEGTIPVPLDFLTGPVKKSGSVQTIDTGKINEPFDYEGDKYVAHGFASKGLPGQGAYYGYATCSKVVPIRDFFGGTIYEKKGHLHKLWDSKERPRGDMTGLKVRHKKMDYILQGTYTFGCAEPAPYRCLVVCPGQLVEKWGREIRDTVPNAKVVFIESYKDVLPLMALWKKGKKALQEKDRYNAEARKGNLSGTPPSGGRWEKLPEEVQPECEYSNSKVEGFWVATRHAAKMKAGVLPEQPTFYILGRDRSKLSCGWEPCYQRRAVKVKDKEGKDTGETRWAGGFKDEKKSRCFRCGRVIVDKKGELRPEEWLRGRKGAPAPRRACVATWPDPLDPEGKRKVTCGERLWQEVPKPKRYAPARMIQKHLRGFFDFLVADEAHEYKGEDSAQADAIGQLASACKKVIALTGTLVGGYAWHVRTLLMRIGAGHTMAQDGFGWRDRKRWDETYGRIERKETISNDDDDRGGRGRSQTRGQNKAKVQEKAVPGIMPTMFKHLVGTAIFLGLDEVAANLPDLDERVVPVDMAPHQRSAYKVVEDELTRVMKEMVRKGNKQLLGVMLNCLLAYPDYPFHWDWIGYYTTNEDSLSGGKVWVNVVKPENLDPSHTYPKEDALIETVWQERLQGRQVWVYCTYTDKRDCLQRLQKRLEAKGLKVAVMRSSITPAERERWIDEHADCNVILSHPDLVKTGLDFFSRKTGHNFVSIMFYQTGYNLFTLRQAARRAWRIGQRRVCKVFYFYYSDSMQQRAMDLMGRKLQAAQALEGRFSSEGLAAMAGDDSNIEMALAKSLADNLKDDEGGARAWEKVSTGGVGSFRAKEVAKADVPTIEDLEAELAALGI